jgi:hypothetical protein
MPSFSPIIDVDEMLSYIDAEKHRVPHYDREHFICDIKCQVDEGIELTDAQFDAVERI